MRLRHIAFSAATAFVTAAACAATVTLTLDSTTLGTTNFSGQHATLSDGGISVVISGSASGGVLPVDQNGIDLSVAGASLVATFYNYVWVTGYGIGSASPGITGNIEFYRASDPNSTFATGINAGTYDFSQ